MAQGHGRSPPLHLQQLLPLEQAGILDARQAEIIELLVQDLLEFDSEIRLQRLNPWTAHHEHLILLLQIVRVTQLAVSRLLLPEMLVAHVLHQLTDNPARNHRLVF